MSRDAARRAPLGSLASTDTGRSHRLDIQTEADADSLPILGWSERFAPTRADLGRGAGLGHVPLSSLSGRDVIVNPGDLVIELNVPTGPPVLVEGQAVIGLNHARLKPMKGSVVTTEWLFVWASSSDFRDQVASRARSLRGRITLRELRSFSVPLAPRERQMAAFDSLRRTLDATRLAERQLELLTNLRMALVDEAIAQVVAEDHNA